MKPKPKSAPRQASLRARRQARGECSECGAPVAVRVIVDAQGRELERRPLSRCGAHR